MKSLVTCVNKIREEKQRKFLFDDTVNDLCQYDPSIYHSGDHNTSMSTKDDNTCTSEGNDITESL